MMLRKKNNLLVEEHLLSLNKIKETETDTFFYTRLKARMERENTVQEWNFPLKPIWLIGAMSFLLLINILIMNVKNKTTKILSEQTNSIKDFAASYDQSVSSF